MSDTPRTDAETEMLFVSPFPDDLIDLCRELEREVAGLREDIECALADDPCLPHRTELGKRVWDRIGRMETELMALRKDKARLEWVLSMDVAVFINNEDWMPLSIPAIDAAMKEARDE